jgi:hypothetical protein
MMKSIQIECGFFSKENLLATQDGYAQNVSPGETAYVSAVAVGSEPSRNLDAAGATRIKIEARKSFRAPAWPRCPNTQEVGSELKAKK